MKHKLLVLLVGLFMLTACGGGMDSKEEPVLNSTSPQATISNNNSQYTLNAGEIDDNDQFDYYLTYRANFPLQTGLVRNVDISRRQIITVVDANKMPIHDARVLIYEEQKLLVESRTYADGRTLFFPDIWSQSSQFEVIIQKDETAVTFPLDIDSESEWVIELNHANQPHDKVQLDVVFLLDATGSMADEIAQLQDNILQISSEIDSLSEDVDIRYGLVHYRDRKDAYITRRTDFVHNVHEFQNALNLVEAGGGGDKPESLNAGLHEAIQDLSWREDNTIKLIFLVADAPPHLDYENDYDYSKEIIAAAWQGIKIHPIASSGLSLDGEYIFRQIAQYTMGHFIFLTYEQGTSGAPGADRTDLSTGQDGNYSVNQLDDLVLRLITDEIAALEQPIANQVLQHVNDSSPQPKNSIPPDISTASLAPDNEFHLIEDIINSTHDFVLMLILISVGMFLGIGFMVLSGRSKRKKAKRTMPEPGIY